MCKRIFCSELERNRIAQIRNRQRNKVQIHRSEKSLSRRVDNDFGSFIDENDDDSKKSKRIGKVVIKLRNGKKLVVKKRRKLNNNEVNTTTQKPVLVTVKSNFKQKSRKNNGNSFGSFNTVSARPPQKLDIGKDPACSFKYHLNRITIANNEFRFEVKSILYSLRVQMNTLFCTVAVSVVCTLYTLHCWLFTA